MFDDVADIKKRLITFFRLCDTNKNGLVTWNEFRTYREQYSYKSTDDFPANSHALLTQDKETFVWLAGGADETNHKGFFTWEDVRSRFTGDL